MFKLFYWCIAAGFLFFLPGISIIMALLYLCYSFVAPIFTQRSNVRPGASEGNDPFGGPESAEVAQPFDPEAAKRKAAAFAAEAEALELERQHRHDEEELLAQNAAHHQATINQSSDNEADDHTTWQERLEADTRG